MLIRVQNESVEISDELYEFLEADRRRQAAEERSDRRHLSKSSFEMVRLSQEYSSRAFEDLVFHRLDLEKMYEARVNRINCRMSILHPRCLFCTL